MNPYVISVLNNWSSLAFGNRGGAVLRTCALWTVDSITVVYTLSKRTLDQDFVLGIVAQQHEMVIVVVT